jgi:hypothetical protein
MYGTRTLAFQRQRIFVRMKIISLIFIRFSYVCLIRNSVTGPLPMATGSLGIGNQGSVMNEDYRRFSMSLSLSLVNLAMPTKGATDSIDEETSLEEFIRRIQMQQQHYVF